MSRWQHTLSLLEGRIARYRPRRPAYLHQRHAKQGYGVIAFASFQALERGSILSASLDYLWMPAVPDALLAMPNTAHLSALHDIALLPFPSFLRPVSSAVQRVAKARRVTEENRLAESARRIFEVSAHYFNQPLPDEAQAVALPRAGRRRARL